jgi:two-component system chemotaxis sensor kinase CheA
VSDKGVSTERPKKTLRLFKRYLGDKKVESFLAEAVNANAFSGQPVEQQKLINILENFPNFVDAIERSFHDYEDRLSLATRNLEISSEELTDALSDLERLHSNINLMLESLDEGLFFFNKEGICSNVYSESCLELIGEVPAGKTLPYILGFNSEETKSFFSWLNIVFSGFSAMDFDDLKALIPREITNTKQRIIELDYKPMYMYGDEITGVLVIADDITFEREARQQLENIQNESMRIKKMAQDKDGTREFLLDLEGFVVSIDEFAQTILMSDDITHIKRAVHTLKGMAATYHFLKLQEECHHFETYLDNNAAKTISKSNLTHQIVPLKAALEEQQNEAKKIFGNTFLNKINFKTFDMGLFTNLSNHIKDLDFEPDAKQEILNFISKEFLSETIESQLQNFKREINRLCELYGKEIPEYDFINCNIKLNIATYRSFFTSLIHLARNIADHALEKSVERIVNNKPPNGHITIKASLQDNVLIIDIADDGRGINPDIIRKKLHSKNYQIAENASDEDILDYIFEPDFSSKENIDMTSGRGIGMNVIKEEVIALNGEIKVTSRYKDNQGTSFKITLPLLCPS